MERNPDAILSFWLNQLTDVEHASEKNWRERMLRWRVGVFARNFEDLEFTKAQQEVAEQVHSDGPEKFFSPPEVWDTPRGWLARLIILDQFSRCIYRGTPVAYDYDALSEPVIEKILENNWDIDEYNIIERMWVYIALSHPENVPLQEVSVKKWTRWSQDLIDASAPENRRTNQHVGWYFVKSVIEHSEAVLVYSRFPHRNAVLCRPHKAGEVYYLTNTLRPLWSFTQPPYSPFYALHAVFHKAGKDINGDGYDDVNDCQEITRDALESFHTYLDLDPAGEHSLMDVFETRGTESIHFHELYRHAVLSENAETLNRLLTHEKTREMLDRVNQAIFRDDSATWPPQGGRFTVPRVLDVPALNLAIKCPKLNDGKVRVSRRAVEAFVKKTNFTPREFSTILEKYRELIKTKQASLNIDHNGGRQSVELSKKEFVVLLDDMFGESVGRFELLGHIFELLDFDYSGKLDAGEAVVALSVLCKGSLTEKLRVSFEAFDADGNGTLDNQEFATFIRTTLLRGVALVQALFHNYMPEDAGREDLMSVFSISEFGEIEQLEETGFAEADRDGDGDVTRSEFIEWATGNHMLGQFFVLHDRVFGPVLG